MTGNTPDLLRGPDLPHAVAYLWEWFWEIRPRVGPGMAGPAPVSFADIEAWARLMRTDPSPWETTILLEIDTVFLNVNAQARKDRSGGAD